MSTGRGNQSLGCADHVGPAHLHLRSLSLAIGNVDAAHSY